MILSNKEKTLKLCNLKSDRHMYVADMRCAEPYWFGGHAPPRKFFIINMVFSTFKAPLLLFETNCNKLNLLYFYINVRLLYTIMRRPTQ